MPSLPPLIGVSACVLSQRHDFHAAADPYLRAVAIAAAGLPMIIPSLGSLVDVDAMIARLDGLMLTGSPSNVEPSRYSGQAPRPDTLLDTRRDETTLPLIARALAVGLPLLAICRGHQELNVALGGTLYQHVQELPGRADHRAPPDKPMAERYAAVHDIELVEGGALSRLAGGVLSARVNSLHAQAIDRLATRLVIEARAADGTIEAVSVADARGFALGVQWHPEWLLEDALSGAVFRAFGEAAAERSRNRHAT